MKGPGIYADPGPFRIGARSGISQSVDELPECA